MKHIGRTAACKEGYGDEFAGMKKAGKKSIQVRNAETDYSRKRVDSQGWVN